MKYNCTYCGYQTENKSAWCTHKKSQRHIKLEKITKEKELLINNSKTDVNIESIIQKSEIELLKERLRSTENEKKMIQERLDDTINQYENRLTEAKHNYEKQHDNTINQYENHIDTLKIENSFQKQLINSAGGLIQKSMNTLSYLLLNYNNAPVLTELPDYSIISKNVDCLIKDLIHYYNKNKLDKHIGDFIVQQYKKKDPESQSFWSSDVDRLNYFIRELINDTKQPEPKPKNQKLKTILNKNGDTKKEDNKKIQWVVDKKGIKMTEYIIDPLLHYINGINTNYINKINKEINDNFDIKTNSKLLENITAVASINCDIKNNKLSNNINKYIAPHFYLEKGNTAN